MKKQIILSVLFLLITAGLALATYTPFIDVPKTAWYADYVNDLRDEEVVDEADYYHPNDVVNRAELVKMVMTTFVGLKPQEAPAYPTFDDVPKGLWFSDDVEAAVTLGIVTGYTNSQGDLIGIFGPNNPVSRAEAARILVKAFELQPKATNIPHYPDVKDSDWFKNDVMIASENGVASGYGTGYFGPFDQVTRAQMAKMLVLSARASQVNNVFSLIVEPQPAPQGETPVPSSETGLTVITSTQDAMPNPTTPETTNVSTRTDPVFVGKCLFKANHEDFRVETLTLVNDLTGDKLGDQPTGSPLIKKVILRFPDQNGKFEVVSTSLSSDGKARFPNLDFLVKRDMETSFGIYVQLNQLSEVGADLSGTVFRVGLQDIGNDPSSFRAVGAISGSVVGFSSSGNFSVTNAQITPFTVYKSLPHFSSDTSPSTLSNGTNNLLSFSVEANPVGSIGLARMVFEVNVSETSGANLNLNDFQLFRGSHLMSHVNIYDATGLQDLSLQGGGSLTNGTSFAIVTFDQEEIVSAGSTQNYTLKAAVSGSESDDSISTRIAQGDENLPLTGLTAVGQDNTGQIYVDSDNTAGIFTGTSDFAQTLGSGRNIIWSDESADNHLYPSISGGVVTSDTGSADWTNGYLLGISGLEDHVISK